MGKGRKPKPAEIRKLQGNPGRRPIPAAPKTDILDDGDLKPPEWMDEEAKAEWDRVQKAYSKLGLLTQTDRAMLIAWCTTVSQFITAYKELKAIEKVGDMIDGHPELKIKMESSSKNIRIAMNESRAALLALAARFGFSPVDRMKLAIPPEKDKEENDIEAFLNKNRKKA